MMRITVCGSCGIKDDDGGSYDDYGSDDDNLFIYLFISSLLTG